ncbi:hypothetical protein [Streptomyces fulvoviolaceus]|nr:hypothetical protein [Streptomyces fulvoviolaceus]
MLAAAVISLIGAVVSVAWAPETRSMALHESAALNSRSAQAHPVSSHV